MPIEKVSEIMQNGRDNHFDSTCVDAFFLLPSARVIAVLESERERAANFDAELFKNLSWQRLVELVSGGIRSAAKKALPKSSTVFTMPVCLPIINL